MTDDALHKDAPFTFPTSSPTTLQAYSLQSSHAASLMFLECARHTPTLGLCICSSSCSIFLPHKHMASSLTSLRSLFKSTSAKISTLLPTLHISLLFYFFLPSIYSYLICHILYLFISFIVFLKR